MKNRTLKVTLGKTMLGQLVGGTTKLEVQIDSDRDTIFFHKISGENPNLRDVAYWLKNTFRLRKLIVNYQLKSIVPFKVQKVDISKIEKEYYLVQQENDATIFNYIASTETSPIFSIERLVIPSDGLKISIQELIELIVALGITKEYRNANTLVCGRYKGFRGRPSVIVPMNMKVIKLFPFLF